ncbi:MAG TPA: metal ABC transporter permease [Candidatus Saccharimonadales bacterium]|nr:metal ABC transporter permease [Candidatus Saccharimonadales bacterium]
MQRAFIAGILIGAAAPMIGTFLVAKRYALIADSLAHVSLAGVALGVLLGINPVLGALGVAMAAALVMEKLRADKRITAEVALAMFLSSGLAVAVVLIGFNNRANINLMSFLFGSITTVGVQDLWIIGVLAALVVGVVAVCYKQLAYTVFDEEQAQASGLRVRLLNQALMLLAALTVVVSLRVVGGLLVGALTVVPVAAASQLARSFKQTLAYAVGIGILAVLTGLVAAFYLNLAAGGAIVLAALVEFFLCLPIRRLTRAGS